VALEQGMSKSDRILSEIKLLRERQKITDVDEPLLQVVMFFLAGSAPSFGLTKLGESAREAETLVWEVLEDSNSSCHDQWQRISVSLDELQGAFGETEEEERARIRFEEATPLAPVVREKNRKLVFLVEDDVSLLQNLTVQIECFDYQVKSFPGLADVRKEVVKEVPAAMPS
jgi:hypothetical protein